MSQTGALILAAGAATRMGQPKQLLVFQGKTLVERATVAALEAGFDPAIVVAGAQAAALRETLHGVRATVVENTQWASGMGSSIAAGMRAVPQHCQTVAIVLADQPLVTATHLRAMQELLESSGGLIVAASYGGSLGVPAIFRRALFEHLTSLAPGEGARGILRDPDLGAIPFDLPEAAVDVDTPADFAALQQSSANAQAPASLKR